MHLSLYMAKFIELTQVDGRKFFVRREEISGIADTWSPKDGQARSVVFRRGASAGTEVRGCASSILNAVLKAQNVG